MIDGTAGAAAAARATAPRLAALAWRAPLQFAPRRGRRRRPAAGEPRAGRHRDCSTSAQPTQPPGAVTFNGYRAPVLRDGGGLGGRGRHPARHGAGRAERTLAAAAAARRRACSSSRVAAKQYDEQRLKVANQRHVDPRQGGPRAHRQRSASASTPRSAPSRPTVTPVLALQPPVPGRALQQLRPAALLQRPAAQPAQRHGHRRADRHADPEPGARPRASTPATSSSTATRCSSTTARAW